MINTSFLQINENYSTIKIHATSNKFEFLDIDTCNLQTFLSKHKWQIQYRFFEIKISTDLLYFIPRRNESHTSLHTQDEQI